MSIQPKYRGNHWNFTDTEILTIAKSSQSVADFMQRVGYNYNSRPEGKLATRLLQLDIKFPRPKCTKVSDEKLIEAAKDAWSVTDLMHKVGMDPTGSNHGTTKLRLHKLGINFSTTKNRPRKPRKSKSLQEHLVLDAECLIVSSRLRDKLIKAGTLEAKCVSCDRTNWTCSITNNISTPIRFHLDHINGNDRDNRLENLRILCPMCHTFTDTYGKLKCNR